MVDHVDREHHEYRVDHDHYESRECRIDHEYYEYREESEYREENLAA